MGSMQRVIEQKKSKGNTRRYSGGKQVSAGVSWAGINAATVLETIQIVSEAGGALRFGHSRDGGALALGVYGDGPEAYTLYAGDTETMNDHIVGIGDVFTAIAAENSR